MIKLLDSGSERNRERESRVGGEDRQEDVGHQAPCITGPGWECPASPHHQQSCLAGLRVLCAHMQLVGWKERAMQSHLAPIPLCSPVLAARCLMY